jgi:hypothetical protein
MNELGNQTTVHGRTIQHYDITTQKGASESTKNRQQG